MPAADEKGPVASWRLQTPQVLRTVRMYGSTEVPTSYVRIVRRVRRYVWTYHHRRLVFRLGSMQQPFAQEKDLRGQTKVVQSLRLAETSEKKKKL